MSQQILLPNRDYSINKLAHWPKKAENQNLIEILMVKYPGGHMK